MYDSGKVIVGILVFLALMSSPFWLNAGRVSKVPEPKKPRWWMSGGTRWSVRVSGSTRVI
jgi:hypothetical protein